MKEIDSAVLESQEHRDLLDIVDKLRSGGVSRYIDLPQIVVCGDQSSGKSSVLEAISGMAFPTKDNLCTRFATEVILRRAPTPAVSFSIAPAADRSPSAKKKLLAFGTSGSLDTLDLGRVIEDARALMGVGEEKAFSSDVLRVELRGPQQPHLTMVDLPGLFRAGNHEQAAEDADLVRSLVLSYMERKRTIMLAVVSAKSDFTLQEVTRLARQLDPEGTRTLGLITKPDTLDQGSDSERGYFNLAQNNDVHFRLGWHVLRNKDFATRASTLEERNKAEMRFFSHGIWSSMSPSHLGVESLRKRLASVLHDQVLSQLPEVVVDLEKMLQDCKTELGEFGQARTTAQQQKLYLIEKSHLFDRLMRDAIGGNYMDPFFGAPEVGQEKRLRAVVQNSLLRLASKMHTSGRDREIVEGSSILNGPRQVTRDAFLVEVKSIISMNRGTELPGTYNPAVIGQLFRKQSKPWRGLLEQRADSILANARDTLRLVLEHILEADMLEGIYGRILSTSFKEMEQSLYKKVDEIMETHEELHPITYNDACIALVQERRLEKQEKELRKLLQDEWILHPSAVTQETLLAALLRKVKIDLDKDASSDAVDWMEAYYDISLKRTLDDFGVLAVEKRLVQKLPGLFSPAEVYLLDDETVRLMAGEPEATAAERSRLTDMHAILEASLGDLRLRTRYQAGVNGKQSSQVV